MNDWWVFIALALSLLYFVLQLWIENIVVTRENRYYKKSEFLREPYGKDLEIIKYFKEHPDLYARFRKRVTYNRFEEPIEARFEWSPEKQETLKFSDDYARQVVMWMEGLGPLDKIYWRNPGPNDGIFKMEIKRKGMTGKKILMAIVWFVCLNIVLDFGFGLLSEANTVANLVGLGILVAYGVLSWKTLCFTKFIKDNEKKNDN
jgi:hypothetical protein